jgi:hypothetical protein
MGMPYRYLLICSFTHYFLGLTLSVDIIQNFCYPYSGLQQSKPYDVKIMVPILVTEFALPVGVYLFAIGHAFGGPFTDR